jgi:hypothetical protein
MTYTKECEMHRQGVKWIRTLGAMWMCVVTASASATAVATADIKLNWDSLVISADPGLTLTPDPVFNGRYANTAYLAVTQAAYGNVTASNEDLAPYNLSFQPIDVLRSVIYNVSSSGGSIAADLGTGPSSARLLASATDSNPDVNQAFWLNSTLGRQARLIVSGTGTLNVAFDYTMSLSTSGVPGADFADVTGIAGLYLQQYESLEDGQYQVVGSPRDQLNRRISFTEGETSFFGSGRFSVSLSFTDATDDLVLVQMSATGIPFANAYADDGSQPVPEPGGLPLVLAGLGAASLLARRRRA